MKSLLNVVAIAAIALLSYSFTTVEGTKKDINTVTSQVTWKGYKVTGSHTGKITIKSGNLVFNDGNLVGGNFVIDMTTILVTDLEGDYKSKLEGHLKSDDFFGVSTFPTASLVISDVKATGKNAFEVTAQITIKGTTEPITFDLSVYGNKATASLKIDRTKFDVRYGSTAFFDGLKDKAIYDEFDIIVDLEF